MNPGSGKRNPVNGSYLNEFRMPGGLGLICVGWNEPGEWFNLTVEAAEAGTYTALPLLRATCNEYFAIWRKTVNLLA